MARMAYGRVTVATYKHLAEAAYAEGLLKDAGILAHVANTEGATLFGGMEASGFSSIRVEVAEADADQAIEILSEAEDAMGELDDDWYEQEEWGDDEEDGADVVALDAPEEVETWTCRVCRAAVEVTSETCWSCGADKDGTPDPTFVRVEGADEVMEESTLPEEPQHAYRNRLADRAWTQAVVGMWLLPPAILIAALFTLSEVASTPGRLTERSKRRLTQAQWICGVWGTITAIFWLMRWFGGGR